MNEVRRSIAILCIYTYPRGLRHGLKQASRRRRSCCDWDRLITVSAPCLHLVCDLPLIADPLALVHPFLSAGALHPQRALIDTLDALQIFATATKGIITAYGSPELEA